MLRVYNNQNQTLAGIYVASKDTILQTDANGACLWKHSFKFPQTLRFYAPDYDTLEFRVTDTLPAFYTFSLAPKGNALNEVIVKSTRINNLSGFATTSFSKVELESKNTGIDLPMVLHKVPGLISTTDAGNGIGYTGFRIRGSDPTRINITVNGVPLNDAESQLTYFVNMPDFISSVQNIQVQRGSGASTNGSGAFGASVHFQTQDVSVHPYARYILGGGSFGTLRNTVALGTGLLASRFSIDLRLSAIQSQGYIDRAASKLYAGFFQSTYLNSKNLIKLIYFPGIEKTYQAWYYVPDSLLIKRRTFNPAGYYVQNNQERYYPNETDNYQQHNAQLHWVHQLKKPLSYKATLHLTRGKGYYEQFKYLENLALYYSQPIIHQGDTILQSSLTRQLWLDNLSLGQISNFSFKNKVWDLNTGISYQFYQGLHFGKLVSAPAVPQFLEFKYYSDTAYKHDANTFVRVVYSALGKMSACLDLQQRWVYYSYQGIRAIGQKPQFVDTLLSFFNPKIGLSMPLSSSLNFQVSYSKAQKEPNRDDFINSIPSSRPKPEQLNDYEAGLEWKQKFMRMNLQAYYMDYRNQLVLDGSINNVGAYNRVNVDRSYRTGMELETEFSFKSGMLFANFCFSKNQIKEYSQYTDRYDAQFNFINQESVLYRSIPIAFSPGLTAAAGAQYSVSSHMALQLDWRYVGPQYLDNTGSKDRMLNSYQAADLGIQVYNFKSLKSFSAQLMMYNIFNSLYETTGYTYGYLVENTRFQFNHLAPAAPLNLMLSLRWNW